MNTATRVHIGLPGHRSPGVGFEAPFEMLGACHERVERMLGLLATLRAHVNAHGADAQAHDAARDVMRYFDMAGPLHHDDEERHVFPPLLAQRDPSLVAVVIRLKHDHLEMVKLWAPLRAVLSELMETGEGWPGFSPEDSLRFDAYDALYRRHLLEEDSVVYPAARRLVRGETLRAMAADMMARRGVADGRTEPSLSERLGDLEP